ncbi:unnamed protein product [Arabis nemorensis]|uniref:DNA (cytosine-5-)-methyltransferase n=1 Tax=Arabis nemorensis TaxID=586526 RepID=A0A565ANC7_9BRAS|nr:unnamed protein product [Arabis nemorensis]
MKRAEPDPDPCFLGNPISDAEAMTKWPLRQRSSKARKTVTLETPTDGDNKLKLKAKHHYLQAMVDGFLFNLGDDVYVKAEAGKPNYIAKIVELFQAIDGEPYFRARWFYRPEDTVIQGLAHHVQSNRVFLSNVEDDNPLNCIISRVNIVKVPPKIASGTEERIIPPCDFYYDMNYELAHLTFSSATDDGEASSTISSECDSNCIETPHKNEKFLLDLYCGCGAMSTGLCAGASLSGVKLITKWAVDTNSFACESLKLNHPETEVRWKGYGPEEDTWEPYDGLRKCKDKLKKFVTKGFKSNLLPLPGGVNFVCGGPPCQGVSGFNRFRNKDAPLEDEKNKQLLVYMDIIDFLKPNYVLMENVVDLLKFSAGFLARYAVARLVSMNYQTRLGMMIAGSYGVPQVRNRVFLWGAQPTEEILVGQSQKNLKLEKALRLGDALSDLPPVTNSEEKDERNYETRSQTDFQKFISLRRADSVIPMDSGDASQPRKLYDHQPLQLNDDDFERVCQIPKKKGANFRDLTGVLVQNNRVKFDPSIERPKLKSGKFLVPDYAMTFVHGRSKKPFGRLWWDEIVYTVVTRAEPHNQTVIHPLQDRVLTVRENARLQGFPDFYKLCGPIKEKYIQVGNAVAVPVGVALGYAFGLASQGLSDDQPVISLPFKYPQCMQGNAEEHSA